MSAEAARPSTQPPPAPEGAPCAGGLERADIALLVGIAIVEAVALTLVLRSGPAGGYFAVPVHLVTLAGLGYWLTTIVRARRDASLPLLTWIATAALGPVGALCGVALSVLLPRAAEPDSLLEAWYERLAHSVAVDPVTRLCDDVMAGRTVDLVASPPGAFLAVMEHGSTADRQTVLGLVARHFDPDYLPVLKAALRSTEPVVRVQAAAVAAHLQPAIRKAWADCIAALPESSRSGRAALDLLLRMRKLAASGLLEEGDRLRSVEICNRLGDVVLSDTGALAARVARASREPVDQDRVEALEGLLIERRRFAELRHHRSARRAVARHPRARIRRVRIAARVPEAA